MTRLRLAFMGTPAFAVPSLAALLEAGHEIAAVYSQPARPAGRGQRLQPSAVQAFAEARGLPVRTPERLKDAAEHAAFRALELDAAVVAAYGLILPRAILEAPRLGCLNVHASLLPRWRGAAPIQRAILAGDTETGVTIMQVVPALDAGPILLQEATPIGPRTTATELHDRLARIGARLIVPALAGLAEGSLRPVPQPEEGVTYAAKVERADGEIDWHDAVYVDRQVRALNPWPGTGFVVAGERLRLLECELVPSAAGPRGMVLDDRLTIACAIGGAVRPTRLQRPGRSPVTTAELLRGFPIPAGTRLWPATS